MCSGHFSNNPGKKIVVDSAEFIVSQINALVKADEGATSALITT
jgi:hypothetical protein